MKDTTPQNIQNLARYRFFSNGITHHKGFATDREAFDHCHGLTDDDKGHVEKLIGGEWNQWDPNGECWVAPVRQINDWYPETRSLLDALVAAGCQLVAGDNGEDQFTFDGDLDKFIANLTACDESSLYVITPAAPGKRRWLYLVYGNNPGELASDYTVDPVLDSVTSAHYEKWEGKPQPKKPDTRLADLRKAVQS